MAKFKRFDPKNHKARKQKSRDDYGTGYRHHEHTKRKTKYDTDDQYLIIDDEDSYFQSR